MSAATIVDCWKKLRAMQYRLPMRDMETLPTSVSY
jgi:hypothetical protein